MRSESDILEEKQGTALQISGLEAIPGSRKLFIESYGCQMNFSDSEIVASIMQGQGFGLTSQPDDADIIFINTCSIRENAELKVRKRLTDFKKNKAQRPGLLVGVLGCMAERLKSKFLEEEKLVDMVIGPDAYRDLPRLIQEAESGQRAINVLLSREETYADLSPLRFASNGISAFVSIMRGCNNMCSFCVVPMTRGRERSRDLDSILNEIRILSEQGFKEVTLLGQNVDSYSGKNVDGENISFATLLRRTAEVDSEMRIRFSTSHPKDMTDEVLYTMASQNNICKYIHLPAQSGSSRILNLMKRNYDREWYLARIEAIRRILPEAGISTDIIAGFCSETDEDHANTLSLMEQVKFDYAYMFNYSERSGTAAAKMFDDVPEATKSKRLKEIIALQRTHSFETLNTHIGKTERVLIEGPSKKSQADLCGRNDQNAMVVFPASEGYGVGMYANVKIESCTSATLLGRIV